MVKLRMERRTSSGNMLMIDIPDEMYANYISIVADLPNDAILWNMPYRPHL